MTVQEHTKRLRSLYKALWARLELPYYQWYTAGVTANLCLHHSREPLVLAIISSHLPPADLILFILTHSQIYWVNFLAHINAEAPAAWHFTSAELLDTSYFWSRWRNSPEVLRCETAVQNFLFGLLRIDLTTHENQQFLSIFKYRLPHSSRWAKRNETAFPHPLPPL